VSPVEIRVEPGLAVAPSGDEICVPKTMCAKMDDWLKNNADTLTAVFGAGPFTFTVCVVLCYKECPTDIVPVPGEPCRDDSEAMQPSRIADSFDLKLCFHDDVNSLPADACTCPVHSARAGGIHELGLLLNRIVVTSSISTGTYATQSDVENEVRKLETLDPFIASLPDESPIQIQPADARAILGAVVRVWTTEVLPVLLQRDGQACCGKSGDKCVLLAQATINVSAINTVLGGTSGITIDDSERPIALSTAVMQEWLLSTGPMVQP
jgi:hypothetical protein